MKKPFSPVRLFVELLCAIGVAEVLVLLVMPVITPGLSDLAKGLTAVAFLVLASAPLIYWRSMVALRRTPLESPGVAVPASAQRGTNGRTAIAMTLGAQLVGLALTVAAVMWQKSNLDQVAQLHFNQGVERIDFEVKRRFGQPLLGLKGARGAYMAREGFTRSSFRRYVESRDLNSELPGLRGLGFIERVPRGTEQAFIRRARADGAPDFAIQSNGLAPDLLIIKYLEPLAGNQKAIGFDVGQEPVRLEAAKRAITTGKPSLTGRVTLAQDDAKHAGFLYFLPVYHEGIAPVLPDARPATLAGLVYAQFVANDLLKDISVVMDGAFSFALFEGDSTQADLLIYSTDEQLHRAANAATLAHADSANSVYNAVHRLSIGGRDFTLRIATTPRFAAVQDRTSLAIVGVGGVFVSFMLSVATWLLAAGRLRAQRRAEHMTADLDRMARVVQHTDNAVSIVDAQRRITWVNPGFTRLTGYTLQEAVGKTPGELLGSGKADPATLQALNEAAAAGVRCRVEILNCAKDGREYWTDTEVQPTHDGNGVLVGFMEIGTDITGPKRTQQALEAAIRDTSALLSTLNVHTITSTADWSGTITEVNEAFCAISGCTREELIGQNHRIGNSGVHPPAFWEDMWAAISSGSSWRGDICNRRKDGSLYWVDSMIAPFIGGDGTVEKFVAIRTDITASKSAQLRMAEMADRLALAIEGGSDGLWDWVDIHTGAQWWSPSYYRLLGYTPEELPASRESFTSILHPDHVERCQEATNWAIAKGKDYDEENLLRTKAHGYRWFRARAKVYRNEQGQTVRMAGSTQDIHDRKLAQASVIKTSQRFALAADSAKIGVWEWDLLTNTLAWDAQMYKLYQHTSSVANTPIAVLNDSLHPQDKERFDAALQDTILSTQRFEGDYRIVWPDGEVRHIRVAARVARNDSGLATRLTGVNFDITEVKRSEEALSHAVTAAEEASRSKSQFLANMSHEIRTPMNAILGMLKLLQNTELTARQSDYAVKTEGAARSLLGLLNDILDFSKVEAGKMTLDPRPFRVDRLLRDLSVILSANVGSKNVEVLFDIDPTLPPMLVGDDMRLQQVLINLGGNAIKFTQSGEVVLRLHVVERTDTEVLVAFAMQDSGIGIAPENQAHIFSGFSQAEASTTRRFGGTGLGLAISSRLVDLLGGALQLDSALGVGSTFHFQARFPVVAALPQTTLTQDLRALGAMPTLIVDDNPVTRTVLCGMAESLGWQVDAVASGPEALACMDARDAAGQPPHAAIFLDWQMPDMDGWQTCERIRQRTTGAQAPMVVMLTAHNREMLSQRSAAEQAQLDGFMVKPVTASMLRDAVLDARSAALAADSGLNPQAPQAVVQTKRLLGLRLLVVEDNKINQMVAQGLLAAEGAEVTLADDGQRGVDAVLRAVPAFDVVLMDIQMPVMDGFEATRTIRQQLGMVTLPIIAMTANAMASDRVACLAAGMNDHVGKPFELDQLVAILLHYSQCQPLAAAEVGTHSAPLPAARLSNDSPSHLDAEGALARMGGNTAMFASVLRSFVRELKAIPQELRTHLDAEKAEDAVRVLHTLKGLAYTVGARHVAGVAAQMEARVTANTMAGVAHNEINALLQGLQTAVDASIPSLLSALAHYGNAAPTDSEVLTSDGDKPDALQLAAELHALRAMLLQSDMQALDIFASLHHHYAQTLGDTLAPLEQAMAALDFARAVQHCTALLEENAKAPA